MFQVNSYRVDLRDANKKSAYDLMCAKFAAEFRCLQFSNDRPKLSVYPKLIDCKNYRLYEKTFEVILDWCEYPSEEYVREGYWLSLPDNVHPVIVPMGAPDRAQWLSASRPSGKPLSALAQAVQWQAQTGCSQSEACRLYGASPSNFRTHRARMIARGEL